MATGAGPGGQGGIGVAHWDPVTSLAYSVLLRSCKILVLLLRGYDTYLHKAGRAHNPMRFFSRNHSDR